MNNEDLKDYADPATSIPRLHNRLRAANFELDKLKLEHRKLQDAMAAILNKSIPSPSIPTLMRSLKVAAENAFDEKEAALAEVAKERDTRRKVYDRFKRVRREAALGAANLVEERIKVEKLERQLAAANRAFEQRESAALRQAALAYRILESEDAEKAGKEPSFP